MNGTEALIRKRFDPQCGRAALSHECLLMKNAEMIRLRGMVSKRRDRPYQGGRFEHWLKVKNRKHPAMNRVMEEFR